MCDEHYQVYSESKRKARKAYPCCECGKKILKGEGYTYATGLYDGSWYKHHTCQMCWAIWQDLKEDISDSCIMHCGLYELLDECELDIDEKFVLINSNTAECMKEEFKENGA